VEILIVGGAGEVGRHLATTFSRKGHGVTILDRAPRPSWLAENLTLTYTRGDISDTTVTRAGVQGKDLVIHLAWSFADDPHVIFEEDIKGHTNLLEAASSTGVCSFIYASTATVYGRAVTHPVTEMHPCLVGEARKPLYALGKYTAEELCRYYHRSKNLPVTMFRFWWAFGNTIGGSHLRELIRKALNNDPLEMVYGAGGAFVTMDDIADAMLLVAERPVSGGRTYNLGSFFITWEEIARIIVHLIGSKSPVRLIPSEQWKGPAFLNEVWDLDCGKAERDLGFRPTASMESILAAFTDALKHCLAAVKEDIVK